MSCQIFSTFSSVLLVEGHPERWSSSSDILPALKRAYHSKTCVLCRECSNIFPSLWDYVFLVSKKEIAFESLFCPQCILISLRYLLCSNLLHSNLKLSVLNGVLLSIQIIYRSDYFHSFSCTYTKYMWYSYTQFFNLYLIIFLYLLI